MANKIKVARATTRQNLPSVLDYGELGYIKNSQLLIGNGDGSEFILNDWKNIVNRPTGDFVTIVAGDNLTAFTPVAVNENGRAVVADKGNELRARVYGFTRTSAYLGYPVELQIGGSLVNPAWSLTAGTTYFLGTAGGLVPSTAGFIATDIIAPLGIALDAHTLALNIEMGYLPGVTSLNGRAGAVTVTKADVGLADVENTKLSTWAGTTSISTVGVISSGTWNGGTITVAKGGTGLSAPGSANTILGVTSSGAALEYKSVAAGFGIGVAHGSGNITISIQPSTTGAISASTAGVAVNADTVNNSTAIVSNTLIVPGLVNKSIASATATQVVDTIPIATYAAAEWIVAVKNGATGRYASKIVATSLGTTVDFTEYGIVQVGTFTVLPSFTVTSDGTNMILTFVGSAGNSISVRRQAV